jgi:hypothetical protein
VIDYLVFSVLYNTSELTRFSLWFVIKQKDASKV